MQVSEGRKERKYSGPDQIDYANAQADMNHHHFSTYLLFWVELDYWLISYLHNSPNGILVHQRQ